MDMWYFMIFLYISKFDVFSPDFWNEDVWSFLFMYLDIMYLSIYWYIYIYIDQTVEKKTTKQQIGFMWKGFPTVLLEWDWLGLSPRKIWRSSKFLFFLKEAGLSNYPKSCVCLYFPGYLEGNLLPTLYDEFQVSNDCQLHVFWYISLKPCEWTSSIVSGSIRIILESPLAWKLP